MKRIVLLLFMAAFVLTGCDHHTIQHEPAARPQPAAVTPESASAPDKPEAPASPSEPISENAQEALVLYHGITLNIDDRDMDYEDVRYTDFLEEKYNREYDFYENGKCTSRGEGKVEGRGLDYYWDVPASEIAFAGNYDPYPREYTVCTSDEISNAVVSDIKSRFKVDANVMKTLLVDLDGDGKTEYIVHAQNDSTYSQFICLLSQDGGIISYLLACTDDAAAAKLGIKDGWEHDLEADMEIIDTNNDGCLEMLVTKIIYEGFAFSVYRYDRGEFTGGEFINTCSVAP